MHNIEDDIDKMFQDAAEGYPLRTSDEDWEKVRAGLISTPSYFWRSITALAVLLLLSTVIISIIGQVDKTELQPQATNASTLLQKEKTEASAPVVKNSLLLEESEKAKLNVDKPTIKAIADIDITNTTKARFKPTTFPSFATFLPSSAPTTTQLNNNAAAKEERVKDNIFHRNIFVAIKTKFSESQRGKLVYLKDLSAITTITKTKQNRSNRKLYFGGGIGIASSWVKDQKWSSPMPTLNVFAGKKISKNFAIEAGVGYEAITYYTTGEYFNPKKNAMPSNMEVRSLRSSNSTLNIPIDLKYDIASGSKNLYFKAGVNNRVLLREKNTYDALMSGVPEEVKASYKDAKFQPLSDIRIAVGVGIPVGKKNSLSVEPYLRLPTKGLGVGNVSLMQGGLQVVFRRK